MTTRFTDQLSVHDSGRRLVESGWDPDRAVAVGSNFMVGNGMLGYRGTSPEQRADGFVALVVTDTYDCADGRWRELTTAPNPLFVAVNVDGVALTIDRAEHVETSLDLARGVFSQTAHHELPSGAVVTIEVDRTASYATFEVLAQRVVVTASGAVERLEVDAGIDDVVWNLNGTHLPSITLGSADEVLTAHGVTGESGIAVAVAASVSATGVDDSTDDGGRAGRRRFTGALRAGDAISVETVAAVSASTGHEDPLGTAVTLARSGEYDDVVAASVDDWTEFWTRNDVTIEGDELDDAALRFNVYHQRICTPAHTDHLPIGARGLSCQAYQGAAFWDQEVYNLPGFLFTEPEIARRLLVYRHRTLDGARRKAARLGYDGAYYAWVSGETGDELCPDVFFTDVLTGREIRNHFNVWQMHVAPDVVTTVARYVQVTDDLDFLADHGAEIAFEVARFLRSFVRYDDWRGTYHCIRLLGPDEWHENVDDNAFTNHQTHAALSFAIDTFDRLPTIAPGRFEELTTRLGLDATEVERWRHVRDHLFLPAPDPATKIIEQFAGFHELESITPEELSARLLDPAEYWGWPNGIAVRTKVSKQADVTMLLWLQRDRFDDDVATANYDHYEPFCSHNSSLSHAAYGMVSARLGETERALDHFRATSRVDLLNTNHAVVAGTFIGGIHTAACGGTMQLAVQGIGGLGFAGNVLVIDPALPSAWTRLEYPVRWRDRRLTVTITHDGVTVRADSSNRQAVTVQIGDDVFAVEAGESVTVDAVNPD